jgi:hypothetical protein
VKKQYRVMSDELDGGEYSGMYVCMYVRMCVYMYENDKIEKTLRLRIFFTRANERSLVFVVNNTDQQLGD